MQFCAENPFISALENARNLTRVQPHGYAVESVLVTLHVTASGTFSDASAGIAHPGIAPQPPILHVREH
jgi:hypothetical protein